MNDVRQTKTFLFVRKKFSHKPTLNKCWIMNFKENNAVLSCPMLINQFNDQVNINNICFWKTFQYIQQAIRRNPSDIDFILQAPDQQDESVWKYEHLRQFCLELNDLTVLLQVRLLFSSLRQTLIDLNFFSFLVYFPRLEWMLSGNLLANDSNWTMDFSLCCT